MAKFSINLLPIESTAASIEIKRKKIVQTISVSSLLMIFFLASLVITLRFLQSRNLTEVNTGATAAADKISNFREKESTLVLLKDRLVQISKLTASPSKQKVIYDSVVQNLPANINVSSVILDSAGNLSISAVAPDPSSLSSFFAALSVNFENISGINVESLSRGRDGVYRMTVRVLAKGK